MLHNFFVWVQMVFQERRAKKLLTKEKEWYKHMSKKNKVNNAAD